MVEGLIYVGTDDGLIQVTEDGGANWRAVDQVPGVPTMTYVSRLEASVHDANTVYATFNNKKQGDFKPYVFVSRDRGRTWSSITGDLPDREIVYALMQDHVKPELLFVGTEFGLYFTVDEGTTLDPAQGRVAHHPGPRHRHPPRRERPRSRAPSAGASTSSTTTRRCARSRSRPSSRRRFSSRPEDALRYVEKSSRVGSRAPPSTPPTIRQFGATFTYYLKDGLQDPRGSAHRGREGGHQGGEDPKIPTYDDLRAEEEQIDPKVFLTVRDAQGEVVRRIDGTSTKGIHRVTWDLRYPSARPISLKKAEVNPWDREPSGQLAVPGTYTVTLSRVVDGVITDLAGPQDFEVVELGINTFKAESFAEALAFQQRTADLERAVRGALKWADEADERLTYTRKALCDAPNADTALLAESQRLQTELNDILVQLRGDTTREKRNVFTPPSISERVNRIVGSQWDTTSAPTPTNVKDFQWAAEAFTTELSRLKVLSAALDVFERQLEAAGAPWTPGRLPEWKMK